MLNTSATGNRKRTAPSRVLFILGVAGAAFLGASTHEAAAQSSVSQIDTASYSVSLTAVPYSRTYTALRPGTATFTVLSKLPYAIDKNQPWTLTLHNPPGDKMAYGKNVYTRADALITDTSVTFGVPFITRLEGTGLIEGTIDVSVCNTEGRCNKKSEAVSLAIEIGPAVVTPPSGNK